MLKDGVGRFYKEASAEPNEHGYGVNLDGRPVKTPGGSALTLGNAALADAVRGEWQAQGEKILPATMPMMQLACTVIDRVSPNRTEIVDQTAEYGGSDLLCYRSEAPEDLAKRQHEAWQPTLDWAADKFDASLNCGAGVLHVAQPESSLLALKAVLTRYDDWELTCAAQLTRIFGSLVLALAVCEGRLDWSDAFSASVLDEEFQAERWGEDREAMQRRNAVETEVREAAEFLQLVRSEEP